MISNQKEDFLHFPYLWLRAISYLHLQLALRIDYLVKSLISHIKSLSVWKGPKFHQRDTFLFALEFYKWIEIYLI